MTNPVAVQAIPYLSDSAVYFSRLKPLGQRVWLDSGKPKSNYGRYDILSAKPTELLIDGQIKDIDSATHNLVSQQALVAIKHLNLPFTGGAIGYFNYEFNHQKLNIKKKGAKDTPSSVFGVFNWAVIQDHQLQKSHLLFLPCCAVKTREQILRLLESDETIDDLAYAVTDLHHTISPQQYCQQLEKIHQYIAAGDTYQINFSQQFCGDFSGDEDAAYLALRKSLPSPFSAYFELADDVILSLSPERFISVDNRHAKTQPIKGTAPRGKTVEDDTLLANDLVNSTKNRAENLMIVDLLRNDFSQSCEPHSVKVTSLFALESFANVHHLVSTIEGNIRKDVSLLDFFSQCFPGGSITGAPKKRAMEIIEELEIHSREIYCGSVVYLSTNNKLDSNITIRTVLIRQNTLYCWGGGGIVADSDTQDEYQESLEKITLILDTLKQDTKKPA